MMTEDYCSFEISKLLKEKGFDGETENYYNKKDKLLEWGSAWTRSLPDEYYPCPTHQMAMKWLREKGIDILVGAVYVMNKKYYGSNVHVYGFYQGNSYHQCDTYEQAVDAALKYSLENLI